jgi:hypothetical protein
MALPLDAEQRLMTRLGIVGPELFRILAEVQEHGDSFLNVVLRDSHGRAVRLIVADPSLVVETAPVLAEHGSPYRRHSDSSVTRT